MAVTDTFAVGAIAAVALGSLFPDIDEPNSWIGKRTMGISKVMNWLFGHRGITHSLFGALAIAAIFMLIANIFTVPAIVFAYFMMGYLLHLFGDSFSKSGVPWLLPFCKKNYQSGFGYVYYVTGKSSEMAVFVVFFVCLLGELFVFL